MTSPTQWTWVCVNSSSWCWKGRPGVLQSMGSQRVGHDWATELNCVSWLGTCLWHSISLLCLSFLMQGGVSKHRAFLMALLRTERGDQIYVWLETVPGTKWVMAMNMITFYRWGNQERRKVSCLRSQQWSGRVRMWIQNLPDLKVFLVTKPQIFDLMSLNFPICKLQGLECMMPGIPVFIFVASMILSGDSRLRAGFKTHGMPLLHSNQNPGCSAWLMCQISGRFTWSEVGWIEQVRLYGSFSWGVPGVGIQGDGTTGLQVALATISRRSKVQKRHWLL